MSDEVKNPEDWFSQNEAHIKVRLECVLITWEGKHDGLCFQNQ